MKTKHILIEILPRAMWVAELVLLLIIYPTTGRPVSLTDNVSLLILGLVIVVFGAISLVWSFKTLARAMVTKKLITTGPYKTIRHPIYSAMYVTLIGIGLLFFSGLWFVILLVFIPVWYLTALAEESQMTDLYPKEYPEYKKSTGMFWPRI